MWNLNKTKGSKGINQITALNYREWIVTRGKMDRRMGEID